MAAPAWLGASARYPALPGQVNQNLSAHTSAWVFAGNVLQASAVTGSGLYVSTVGQHVAQQFTTGPAQSTIGQVALQVAAVGGSPSTPAIPPLALGLYASADGQPTGPALASAQVPGQYVYTAAFWVTVPLLATGLTPSTTYQLVLSPAGAGAAYYAWQRSNQPSGAATSPDGATWTNPAYGLMFQVYDQSATSGPPVLLVDDLGARWLAVTWNASGQPATSTEYVATQNGAGLYQTRTFTYSGNQLIGVA